MTYYTARSYAIVVALSLIYLASGQARAQVDTLWTHPLSAREASLLAASDDGVAVIDRLTSGTGRLVEFSPEGDIRWEWQLDDFPNIDFTARALPDGGFIVAGGAAEGLVARLNAQGDYEWRQNYDNSWGDPRFDKLVLTADGGVLASGEWWCDGCGDGSDVEGTHIAKVGPNGEREWYVEYVSPLYTFFVFLDQLAGGNYLAIGTASDEPTLFTFSPSGVEQPRVPLGLGGRPSAVVRTSSGTYLVAVIRSVDNPYRLVEIDSTGTVLSESVTLPSFIYDVVEIEAGKYLAVGRAQDEDLVFFVVEDGELIAEHRLDWEGEQGRPTLHLSETQEVYLKAAGLPGSGGWFVARLTNVVTVTSEPSSSHLSAELQLGSYPNPLRSTTTVTYAVPKDGPVRLEVYDVLGRRVRTLIGGEARSAGEHTLKWDGTNTIGLPLPSGVYVLRLTQGGKAQSLTVARIR